MNVGLMVFLLAMLPGIASACTLEWDYENTEMEQWAEGFRFYQGATQTGTAPTGARSIACDQAGFTPSADPITMTIFRGPDESPQSAPATFSFSVVEGVRFSVTVEYGP